MSLYKGEQLIAGSGGGSVDKYSTDEVKTNKVWIDGKPIYRKVVDCGTMPNATSKAIPHGISNLDVIVDISVITRAVSANAWQHIPSTSGAAGGYMGMYVDKTNINLDCGLNRSGYDQTYATIEYTKSTD